MVGPTAAAKSEIALRLARTFDLELVSVDSMQVYRGMDIGTAKPSLAERAEVRHHMIDVADPSEDYTVAEFQAGGRSALEQGSGVIVGGSGLHFRSLVDPLEFPPSDRGVRAEVDGLSVQEAVDELLEADADAAEHVDLDNARRVQRAVEIVRLSGGTPTSRAASPAARDVRDYVPHLSFTAIGLDPGETIGARIERRIDVMLDMGLLGEVETLESSLGRNAAQAVGYKELIPVVRGEKALSFGRQAAIDATISLAKRQRTFFRRDPRIQWVPWSHDPDGRFAAVLAALERTTQWIS